MFENEVAKSLKLGSFERFRQNPYSIAVGWVFQIKQEWKGLNQEF